MIRASFETRSASAPQDEVHPIALSTTYLILRRPRRGRLEGRTLSIHIPLDCLVSVDLL
jgi:hypothetical protein